jgi:DMSO/TMAO reductase YedYZ molybdopterin-dependent catalytic subunit
MLRFSQTVGTHTLRQSLAYIWADDLRMGGRRTNLALLVLLSVAFLTGWIAFAFFSTPARLALLVHAGAGFAILLLLPWKSLIARRGLRRPRPARWASVVFGVLIVVSLAAGLAHSLGRPWPYFGDLTAMEFHVGAALAAIPFFLWHAVARRVKPRPTDLSRRALLRGTLLGAGALVLAAVPGAPRRLTGSYEVDHLPGTQWMFDAVPAIDRDSWRLSAGGREWTYTELAAYEDRVAAVIDCTGGWYSEQEWEGVRLSRLLRPGPHDLSLLVRSATGYARRFDVRALENLVLATRVAGADLLPENGFPIRLVAPRERGFWWVKWVIEVRTEPLPAWWQTPFPLQ